MSMQGRLSRYDPGQFYDLTGASEAVGRYLGGETVGGLSPEATTAYAKQNVLLPSLREFDQTIRPRIADEFSMRGGTFSTRRGEAASEALGDIHSRYASTLAAWQQANMMAESQNANAAANRSLAAVPLAGQVASTPIALEQALGQSLSGFQNYYQSALDREYASSRDINPWIESGLGFLSDSTSGTAVIQDTGSDILGTIMGGLSAFGMGSDMFGGIFGGDETTVTETTGTEGSGPGVGSSIGSTAGSVIGNFIMPGVGGAAGGAIGSFLGGMFD